jgi:hypothetical protein
MNLDKFHVGQFRKGVHYRELEPVFEGQRRWRFGYQRDNFLCIEDLLPHGRVISFRDKAGREWMRMVHNGAWIRKDYAWNGCTPKYYALGRWWGTPDYEATRHASGTHDAFCQFLACEHFPLHRSDVDEIFRLIIVAHGAPKIAETYHREVRRFGKYFKHQDQGEHSVILHP